jgi:hypothetical protein
MGAPVARRASTTLGAVASATDVRAAEALAPLP